jgi:hypothetical protein
MKKLFLGVVALFILGFISSDRFKIPKRLLKSINNEFEITSHLLHSIPTLTSSVNDELLGKFFNITSQDEKLGFAYLGRVNTCRVGGCESASLIAGNDELSTEYFEYFIIYNTEAEVQRIQIYNYQANHGQEVSSRGWLKQFIGFNTELELEVGKNIDGISGATISVYALTANVEYVTSLLGAFISSKKNDK